MTATIGPMNPLATPTPRPFPRIGELVPLGQCVVKVDVSAQTTMPDTPNGYTAALKVMSDQGDLDTEALAGEQGPAGNISFQVREAVDPYINSPADLPVLTNSPKDIGRYYLLEDVDAQGNIVGQSMFIWYGTAYRKMFMGAWGPPGPVPNITPEVELIDPELSSYIETSGPRLDPYWFFHLAAPAGIIGPLGPVASFPDFDASVAPVYGQLLTFSGQYNTDGQALWHPKGLGGQIPTTYSMPESAFVAYNGVSQQAPVGSFVIPPQPFAFTPIVWGHLGHEYGVNLSANPLLIGCQVLLGDPVDGQMIARGLGNTLGVVNIMPHYSTGADKTKAITPNNKHVVIPPNHTNPATATLYVNLWNDGQLGVYNFNPAAAQLFVMLMPMDYTPPPGPPTQARGPIIRGHGRFSATATKV